MNEGNQGRKDENFVNYLKKASEVVQTWPVWKQTVLGTANTSYARKHSEESTKNQQSNKND